MTFAGRATGNCKSAFRGTRTSEWANEWRTCSTGKKLIENDLDWIEPIQHLRLATIRDAAPIPLAVIPKADLIEVVKTQCSCD